MKGRATWAWTLAFATLVGAPLPSPAEATTRRRAVYEGRMRVVDGDTLRLGGDSLRLWGVDAPEGDQYCLLDRRPSACGELARDELRRMIANRRVRCEYRDWQEGHMAFYPPRAIVWCTVAGIDIGDWLVSRGLAVPSFTPLYVRVGELACESRRGLWAGAWSEPYWWRLNRERAAHGLGAQSGRSCRQAFRDIRARMTRR